MGEGVEEHEATELSVTVENKKTGSGLMFYCSTQTGEEHRYVIGNVKSYASAEERDSMGSYNGPDFEDLDDKLHEATELSVAVENKPPFSRRGGRLVPVSGLRSYIISRSRASGASFTVARADRWRT